MLWLTALSPYGFRRFSLADGDRVLVIHRAGTYEVFEEFPGAAAHQLPSPLEVSVIDTEGRAVEVQRLVRPGDRAPVDTYDLPLYEGRGVARFDAPRTGRYLLRVGELDPGTYTAEEYSRAAGVVIAVGPSAASTWIASPLISLVVGPVPFVVGIVVIVVTTRAARARGADAEQAAESVPGARQAPR